MQIRVHRALAAVALVGLAATAAEAQQRRIPVTKDRQPVDTAPTPQPVRRDTVYLRDTVTVYRTDTVTVTQQASTGVVAAEAPVVDLPGDMYFQLGGGASMPRAQFGDFFDTGFNVTGSLGWQPVMSALGLRLDVAYDKWAGEDVEVSGGNSFRLSDASVFSALANATVNLPIGNRASGSGLYLIGGGGLHFFNDYPDMQANGFPTGEGGENSSTDWGVNGGAGLRFGFGRAALFAESRYFHVFTEEERTNFLPIIVGFTFR